MSFEPTSASGMSRGKHSLYLFYVNSQKNRALLKQSFTMGSA